MTRRRAGVVLLGAAIASLTWTAAFAPAHAAEHRCHGSKHCTQTPQPEATPQDLRVAQTQVPANPATTPRDTTPASPGPVVGVVTTPPGLQSVAAPTGLVPTPHPAGDLTLAILLLILGLSVAAIVTFVLAISMT